MKIQRIGILGAGAVGASLLHQIEQNIGLSLCSIIAQGDRAEEYRRNGFRVNGDLCYPDIVEDGVFDLILLATKSYHLESALPLLDACMGQQTLVLSLLNGISSESILGDRYDHRRVIPGMILGIDAMRDDLGIRYLNRGVVHFGENPLWEDHSTEIDGLERWFRETGLSYRISENIQRTLWRKFMINVGVNQSSAILGAPYGVFQKDADARSMMKSAMEEVVILSRREGIGLADQDIEDWLTILDGLNPQGKTSMLQDVEAGRRTEVDLFAGTVLELAEKHNLEVPMNWYLWDGLLEIEARRSDTNAP